MSDSRPKPSEELLALSGAIAAKLQIIADEASGLEALERRLEGVVAALRLTRELADAMDLERLERRLASIATALRTIKGDETVQELSEEK